MLDLIAREYHDYGPTLITELLSEAHGIRISRETVRKWMIADCLWTTSRVERRQLHQPRKRQSSYGALVQIDGSDHDWFEGRRSRCTLMVYVDDATGALQHLMFFERETAEAYAMSTRSYLIQHGRPLRFQTDRHAAIYARGGETIYSETLKQLGISHSIAYSPQSKGRVERMHRTLQDRLTKALRRKEISTIQAANEYLPTFIDDFNRRFAHRARQAGDLHRPISNGSNPDRLFAKNWERKLSKQLTFSLHGVQYVVASETHNATLAGKRVIVEQQLCGGAAAYLNGRKLQLRRT